MAIPVKCETLLFGRSGVTSSRCLFSEPRQNTVNQSGRTFFTRAKWNRPKELGRR